MIKTREQAENVSLDSFLYHCTDSLNAITTRKGIVPSHIQYPPFLNKTWKKPSRVSLETFLEELEAILGHHNSVSPYIKKNLPVDTENLFGFCTSLARIIGDLTVLCKSYFGVSLPYFPEKETVKYMAEGLPFKVLGKLLVRYDQYEEQVGVTYRPFSHDDYGTQEEKLFSHELWSLIHEVVDFHLPFHSELFMTFAKYKFSQESTQKTNWKDLPPVGYHYEKAIKQIKRAQEKQERMDRRRNRDNKRGDKGYKKDFKEKGGEEKEHAKGNHGPRPERDRGGQKNAEDNKRSQRPRRTDKGGIQRGGQGRSRSLSAEGAGNGPQRAPRRGGRSSGEGNQERQAQVDSALVELENAIQVLAKNQDLPQVQLAPQNSYIRSLQHATAKEKGFKTQSVGEDRQRAVCLLRKN